jgi:hypothetical protein
MQQWILKTPFAGHGWKELIKKTGFYDPKNKKTDFAAA